MSFIFQIPVIGPFPGGLPSHPPVGHPSGPPHHHSAPMVHQMPGIHIICACCYVEGLLGKKRVSYKVMLSAQRTGSKHQVPP